MQEVEGLAFDLTGGVATITLNRPEKLNAFTPVMQREIVEALAATAVRVSTISFRFDGNQYKPSARSSKIIP